jgi:hypothetical protein
MIELMQAQAQSVRPGKARRRSVREIVAAVISIAVVAAGVLAAALAITDGSGGGSSAGVHLSTASPAKFRTAIIARLRAQHLNYKWVACVSSGRHYGGVRIVRCNVDFGIDPHVEAYCSVLRGGRLLTSKDDHAIPCGADKAGRSPKLITYG